MNGNYRQVVQVTDNGDNWLAGFVTTSNRTMLSPGTMFLPVSASAAEVILEEQEAGNIVQIPKAIEEGAEVIPLELHIIKVNELEKKRWEAINDLDGSYQAQLSMTSIMDIMAFNDINAKMIAKGYNLTVDHTSEIELINSDDTEVFELYAEWKECRDSIYATYAAYKKVSKHRRALMAATTVAEVNAAVAALYKDTSHG